MERKILLYLLEIFELAFVLKGTLSHIHTTNIYSAGFRLICVYSVSSLRYVMWDNPFKYLTLKAPIRTAADDIHKYFFSVFQRK